MDAPRISLVIPVWGDHLAFIEDCLAGLHNQQAGPLEVWVVDNANPQPLFSAELQLLAPAEARVRVLRLEQRAGVQAARLAGLRAARGEFVAFLDSDDQLLPGALGRLMALLDTDPAAVLATGHPVNWDGQQELGVRAHPSPHHYQQARNWSPSRFALANLVSNRVRVANLSLFRRELLAGLEEERSAWFCDSGIGEDWAWVCGTLWRGQVLMDPRVAIRYRIHPISFTAQTQAEGGDYAQASRTVRRALLRAPGVPWTARAAWPWVAWQHWRKDRAPMRAHLQPLAAAEDTV